MPSETILGASSCIKVTWMIGVAKVAKEEHQCFLTDFGSLILFHYDFSLALVGWRPLLVGHAPWVDAFPLNTLLA